MDYKGVILKVHTVPLDRLKYPEHNVRKHPPKQIKELVRSLEAFGQTRPVVVDENNVILAGNGLVQAMQEAFWESADVLVKRGLTQDQKRKLMLVDNKMSFLGVTDYDVQFEYLESIIKDTGAYDVPGFEADMLEALLSHGQREVEQKILGQDPSGADKPEEQPQATQAEKYNQMQCPQCGGVILWS